MGHKSFSSIQCSMILQYSLNLSPIVNDLLSVFHEWMTYLNFRGYKVFLVYALCDPVLTTVANTKQHSVVSGQGETS